MCGRFTQYLTWAEIHRLSSRIGGGRNLQARYNIAPTTPVEAIRLGLSGQPEMLPMRWGLIPPWWDKARNRVPATFNARIETVEAKPMFRTAFQTRRCVIPASGFYQWTGPASARVPHYFTAPGGSVLPIAGLWDRWTDRTTGDVVDSCTMIVGPPNEWMQVFHERQPMLLGPDDVDAWLSGAAGKEALLLPPIEALREWAVSPRVNKAGVGDDDPTTIAPVGLPEIHESRSVAADR